MKQKIDYYVHKTISDKRTHIFERGTTRGNSLTQGEICDLLNDMMDFAASVYEYTDNDIKHNLPAADLCLRTLRDMAAEKCQLKY